jgi:hypothetical protein
LNFKQKVINFLAKYWIEILVFASIFTVLMIDCTPDYTWINTDCDGPHYTYSAQYLYPAHKTSAPLFLLIGNLFLRIPLGMEAWRFALLSVFASTITCVFIYLIIRNKTNNKWFGISGALVFGSSALVISQSIIIETYALVTMFGVLAYYFSEKKRWAWTAIMLGAGGAIHHLIGFPIVILLIAHKEFRNWKYLGIMASFLLFYLYIPITNRPPYMWQSPNSELGSSFFIDNLSTMMMLWGGLSIWEFPKRILDTFGLLAVSLGLSIIPIMLILKQWKTKLFWLFILPIIYYAINLAPQTYVYMMPSIAFGSILAGIGLSKIGTKYAGNIIYNNKTKFVTGIIVVSSIIMLEFNCNYFDIGRTLDKDLSARAFYDTELSKVPDGHILLAQQGWEWAMVYPYNKNENRNIIPVCVGTLASKQYQDLLKSWNINFDVPTEKMTLVELQDYILKSIIANNKNVWTTFPVEPKTYKAEIAPLFVWNAPLNTPESEWTQSTYEPNYNKLLNNLSVPQGVTDGSSDMKWKWKPSNPYDIITGSIEVEEWIYIIFSNYSIATFAMIGMIGATPCWILWMTFVKKKKFNFRRIIHVKI